MASTPLATRQQSVQRALGIFRQLLDADAVTGLSVTEAAQEMGVDKSTASRLLATLAAAGMVVADETHRYHVGPLAFQLGNRFRGATLARTAQPIIRRLAETMDCTAQLGTLQAQHVLYLQVAQAGRLRVAASPGDQRFVHASAMGKALLASLPAPEQDELIKQIAGPERKLPPSGPNTLRDIPALRADLAAILAHGYSRSDEEAAEGICALGVMVKGPSDFPLAVSVAFPKGRFAGETEEKRVIDELNVAADAIAQRFSLGH